MKMVFTSFFLSIFVLAAARLLDLVVYASTERKRKEVVMTNNQVQYQRNLETERANRAQEALRDREIEATKAHYERSDRETERANFAREGEAVRHNVQDELLRGEQIAVQREFNTGQLQLRGSELDTRRSELAETIRKNMASESLQQTNLDEQGRHNKESERLTGRGQDVAAAARVIGNMVQKVSKPSSVTVKNSGDGATHIIPNGFMQQGYDQMINQEWLLRGSGAFTGPVGIHRNTGGKR